MRSTLQKLQSELTEIWQANQDPIGFADKMGIAGPVEYKRGFARGWIEMCVKNAKLYAEILGNEAVAVQLATPLQVVD